MASTETALKNSAWLLSEKAIVLLGSLLVNVILARYLAPEKFGQLSFIISFLAILIPFASMGVSSLVTREIVCEQAPEKVLFSAFVLRVIGCLICLITVFMLVVSIDYMDKVVDSHWLIVAALVSFSVPFFVVEFYFEAKVTSKYLVLPRVILFLLFASVKIFGVISGYELQFFILVFFLEFSARAVAYSAIFFVRFKPGERLNIDRKLVWNRNYVLSLFSQSKWLMLSGFMSVIYLKIDQIMIGYILGSNDVGVYSVAARISEVWYFIPTALMSSFFPELLRKKKDPVKYSEYLEDLCGKLFWLAFLIALVMTTIGPQLILIVFGEAYSTSGDILVIHIWAGCFIFVRAVLSKWLIAEGLVRFSLYTHGSAAVVNVLLNLILIPELGGVGAAIATVISYGVSSYIVLWMNKNTIPMAIIMSKSFFRPILLLRNISQ